jgi:DNA topoisomerase I
MSLAPLEDLVYVHGGEQGLRRERRKGTFVYLEKDGDAVDDPEVLERIGGLRIPPAWTQVWIAAEPNAHLQATGLDSKGRRQYLYHPNWRRRRDEEKFRDMLDFGAALPTLRQVVHGLLDEETPRRECTLALAVRLLDVGFFRVGWDRYARDNGHVGLTTLRRDNVAVGDAAARFDFVAKSGKRRRMTLADRQSVRLLRPLTRRRPGPAELLVFLDAGSWHRIHANDVNNALRAWAEGPYSAKEFRTWAATVLAAVALAREHEAGQGGRRAVSRAVREVSTALGNTPTVARASYIDPRVIDLFEGGVVIELPTTIAAAAVPRVTDDGADGVVIEWPTEVAGDADREAVERRVLALLDPSRGIQPELAPRAG